MKINRFLKFLLSIVLTVVYPLFSYAGGGSDGGTKWSVHQFVVLANYLIKEPSQISDEDREILQKGLTLVTGNQQGYDIEPCLASIEKRSGICEDATLIDPLTKIVLDQNFIAYGSSNPPLIQLRVKNNLTASFQSELEQGKPVAQYIFHELFRASGVTDSTNSSPDHNFQLSLNKYHLEKFKFPSNLISLPNAKNRVSNWDDEKLANYRDICRINRLKLLSAKLDGQAKVIDSLGIGISTGINSDLADELKQAMLAADVQMIETFEGRAISICELIDIEWKRRYSIK